MSENNKLYKQGIFYALLCYFAWGSFPLFWKQLAMLPAVSVLAHRIVWSFLFLFIIVLVSRNKTFFSYLKQPKTLLLLMLSGATITLNWGVYIYAVESSQLVEASLGYYINPLINVLLGVLFLKERLNKLQVLAVVLAFAGVAYITFDYGKLPWVSVALALTFGLYGLVKKQAKLESIPALAIETMAMVPFALAYLFYISSSGQQTFFPQSSTLSILLVLGGVITAIPLYWFGKAAPRIPLSTIGFIQYISPSIQLLIGVMIFNEVFSNAHMVCFGFVWAGLAVYTVNMVSTMRKK